MKSADKKADQLAVLLDDAERAAAQLDPKKADEALREAKKLLDDPEIQLSPDREIHAGRYAELTAKMAQVREAKLAKDIEEAVRDERSEIGPSLQTMKDATEALAGGKADEKTINAARDSVAALEKAVGASDDRRVFALKDSSFVGYLKRAKAEAEKARAELTKSEKRARFLAGPVALKLKANADLKESRTTKDLEKKRELIGAAATGYGQCLSGGLEYIKGGFADEKIVIEGKLTSADAFLETCKSLQKSTAEALAKLPKPRPPKPAKPAAAPKKKK